MNDWLPVFVFALADKQVPHANDNAEKTQNATFVFIKIYIH